MLRPLLFLICLLISTTAFRLGVGRANLRRCHVSRGIGLKQNDDLEGLKLDESKLSAEERERLAFIQKLSTEADEMIRAAGFSIDGEQDAEEIERAVKDTKWSGQSDVESTISSTNSFADLTNRPGLAFTDMAALLTFSSIGRSNHGEDLDVFSILFTALPFVAAWFTVSPFAGAYSRAATASRGLAIPKGILLGWAAALPLALGLRGLLKSAVPPTPFIIVSLVATFSLLSVYRLAYVYLFGVTSDEETKSAGAFEVFKMLGSLIKRW